MSQVRVRPKHQITIPANIARDAGIKTDDLLEVSYAHGVVTLKPAGRDSRGKALMDYAGIGRGAWGQDAGEIDAQLAADRAAWER
jgi:AbrB family looped-hinge helix DNA binding protein